jgi:hypothetical protein
MRPRVRRVLVVVLAAFFAVGGLTSQSCMAKHLTLAPEIASNHSHDLPDHNAGHGKHHHDHQIDAATTVDKGQQPIDDHACMKCCSLCIASGIAPSYVTETTVFKISFVVFIFEQVDLFGHTISVDPGIPKRIV